MNKPLIKVTYPVTDVRTFEFEGIKVYQEFHDDSSGFHHRIRIGSYPSNWAGYSFMAILAYDSRKFAGCTEYYECELPSVFEIIRPKR